MYSMGDTVNNTVLTLYSDRWLTRLIVVIILQCIQMLNHYVVHMKLI